MAGKVAYLERHGEGLFPRSAAYEDIVQSLPEGRLVQATIVRQRSIVHHNKIWQEFHDLAGVFRAHGREGYDQERVKRLAIMLSGDAEVWPLPPSMAEMYGGVDHAVMPASISYASKDEAQILDFHEAWKAAFYELVYPAFGELAQRRIDLIFASLSGGAYR